MDLNENLILRRSLKSHELITKRTLIELKQVKKQLDICNKQLTKEKKKKMNSLRDLVLLRNTVNKYIKSS